MKIGWIHLFGCKILVGGYDLDAELLDDEIQSEKRLE